MRTIKLKYLVAIIAGVLLILLVSYIFGVLFGISEARADEIASFYGNGESLNKHTANGEIFNPNDFTAAMWDVPFNAKYKVTNISNGKSVIVRINDRGPARRLGRAIDLTRIAFEKISPLSEGLIRVKIEQCKK